MNVSKSNYGNYSSSNYGAHSLRVDVGNLTFYFSYDTVIAFRSPETGLIITQNNWSTTTGKHLNWINEDKKIRIPYEDFKKKLDEVLTKHNLTL